jgi:hypothetical protein
MVDDPGTPPAHSSHAAGRWQADLSHAGGWQACCCLDRRHLHACNSACQPAFGAALWLAAAGATNKSAAGPLPSGYS